MSRARKHHSRRREYAEQAERARRAAARPKQLRSHRGRLARAEEIFDDEQGRFDTADGALLVEAARAILRMEHSLRVLEQQASSARTRLAELHERSGLDIDDLASACAHVPGQVLGSGAIWQDVIMRVYRTNEDPGPEFWPYIEAVAAAMARRPCPLCKGKGYALAVDAIEANGALVNPRDSECMVCDGEGTVEREVT